MYAGHMSFTNTASYRTEHKFVFIARYSDMKLLEGRVKDKSGEVVLKELVRKSAEFAGVEQI